MKRILVLGVLMSSMIMSYGQKIQDQRVAVVLGGGGALGYAHIGVLQALDEAGIHPTYVAGTSMGALIGVLYAAGYSGEELLQIVRDYRLYSSTRILEPSGKNPRRGMGSFRHVRKMLQDKLPHNSFDSLPIPFACTATNLMTNQLTIRQHGDQLTDWVLASASIPVVFQPQLIADTFYCDGGLIDNLPAACVPDDAADIIISIDLVPTDVPDASGYFSKQYSALNIYGNFLLSHNSEEGRAASQVVLRPNKNTRYGIMDFGQYEQFYRQGYECMKEWLGQDGRANVKALNQTKNR